ncbi:MAG: PLDc N-terminal domain-containing protein [Deltaproteobacteria bacterium]|nr:PLDc N-terminal domain-containing protein [Deltaproteobacteria bacterium]
MTVFTVICSSVAIGFALWAAGHALVFKRDSRAALGWIGFCLLFPVVGSLSYWLFGINRIATRARKLDVDSVEGSLQEVPGRSDFQISPEEVPTEFSELARLSEAVTARPLLAGNRVEALHGGERAYPAMLKAIDEAQRCVYLSTYIFDGDTTGLKFADALVRARQRGVEVRVILDGVGEHYSRQQIRQVLLDQQVPVARFLPPRLFPPAVHLNLRNHRKILAVDGQWAFTGGMNLGDRHLEEVVDNPDRVVDVHFRLSGPIAGNIESVFRRDWAFLTGEILGSSPPTLLAGEAFCRAVVDGPDENLGKLAMILVGALSAARQEVAIMTPYFLPSRELIGALQAAALRGVQVSLILPAKNNLFYLHWATRKMLWEILQRGVRVYYQPPPFVHSKLLVVDRHYVQIGSANLDPRSLRLNFELNVGVYDHAFGSQVALHCEEVREVSKEVTLEEMDSRSIPLRMRDAFAWLFSPYL